jgi:hypothetical protein
VITARAFIRSVENAVKRGLIDGIALPFEGKKYAPRRFGKTRPIEYRYRGGSLYFKRHGWKAYGYEHERQFENDVSKRRILSKTALGCLSLGDAINPEGRRITVSLFFSGEIWRLTWHCRDQSEAAEIVEAIRKIAPEANPIIASGHIGWLLAGWKANGRGAWSQYHSLPDDRKAHIRLLLLAGVSLFIANAGSCLTQQQWLMPISGIAFCAIFLALHRHAAHTA